MFSQRIKNNMSKKSLYSIEKLICVLFMCAFLVPLTGCASDKNADKLDLVVFTLINKMPADAVNQRQSIEALWAIGSDGLPYIIKYMNDFRELPQKFMRVAPGQQFEEYRTDSSMVNVDKVINALMYVAEGISGQSYEQYIYDFEVKSPDDLAINKWRKWCISHYPDKARICLNEK